MLNNILEIIKSILKKIKTNKPKSEETKSSPKQEKKVEPSFKAKYFSLNEMIVSETAARLEINNTPKNSDIENLQWLCKKVLDPLRTKLGKSIVITSGYRSPVLNRQIGGSSKSQHCLGKAADIIIPGMTAQEVFNFICKNTKLPYDQIIQEFGRWVHISYDRKKSRQRNKKMLAVKVNGKTIYKKV